MRWRRKVYSGPRIGDIRIRKHFAVFPARIELFTIWLEPYYTVEKCWHVHGGFAGGRWKEEYRTFDLRSSADYVTANYERYTYLKARRIYRNLNEALGNSPWYQETSN